MKLGPVELNKTHMLAVAIMLGMYVLPYMPQGWLAELLHKHGQWGPLVLALLAKSIAEPATPPAQVLQLVKKDG